LRLFLFHEIGEPCKGIKGALNLAAIGIFGSAVARNFLHALMFIIMTIETQQLPITAIARVIIMVMIAVMNGQFAHIAVIKLPLTAPTHPRIHFKCLLSIAHLPLTAILMGFGNNLIKS